MTAAAKPFDWNDYGAGELLKGMRDALLHLDFDRCVRVRGQWVCYHKGGRQIWTNSFYPD